MTINDRDFLRLTAFVRDRFGINLEHKRQLIDARLSFYINRSGYTGFTQYLDRVTADPNCSECHNMINRLSTNYTFFFRETDYVSHLENKAVPHFISGGKTHLRIWCAACSSGQEAYSIAMVLEEKKLFFPDSFDYEIVGTDINTDMLAVASSGIYPEKELDLIPKRFRRFVTHRNGEDLRIVDKLKSKVLWKYQNLLDASAVHEKYDIIFCRNVMIYFTPPLRSKMTVSLCSALVPGGYLYTGSTESIDLERRYFYYISPAIYQRR